VFDRSATSLHQISRRLGLDWEHLQDLPLQVDLAPVSEDPHLFAERVQTVIPLNHFADREKDGGFLHTSAALICGDLTLSSSIHTALDIELGEHPFATLALPYAGQASIWLERREYVLGPGNSALYMPGQSYTGRSQAHAGVMLNLAHQALARTAQSIAGSQEASSLCRLALQRPIVVGADTSLSTELILSLRRMISVYNGAALLQSSAVHSLALEDAIQRLVILLLCPELLSDTEADRQIAGEAGSVRNRIFDELIDWILTDLTRPLTLSELERRSGYSRRALQYLFRSRFGLGPMQWLREQRLQAVWHRLKAGHPGDTVGAIANHYGFVSSSSFARLFQTTFGEPPSVVLRASQRRNG